MANVKRILSVFLAVLCAVSVFFVSASAATKYKDYGGKYGKIIPVKSDYKTVCENYTVKGEKGGISFSFKSKGYKKDVYYGVTIYGDEKMQNILVNIGKPFPTVNSYGTISVDFSPLDSGVYYGIAYTFVLKGSDYVVDSSSIYTYKITVNKLAKSTLKITDVNAQADGTHIKWAKLKYADGYLVYRKQEGTDFEKIAQTTKAEYKDKTAVQGEKYYYTVRAYDASTAYKSLYNKKGVPAIFLAPVVLGEPQLLSDNRIRLAWSEVKGADSYRVYRKTDGGSYERIATVSADALEFTDKSAKENGSQLSYKVRAVNETCLGLVSSPLKVKVFGIFKPTLSCKEETVKISWKAIEDATHYTLFKKTSGNWEPIYTGTETEFVDSGASKGEKYYYSLVVHKENEQSSFDSSGVAIWCLSEPVIKTLANSIDNSVAIKWNAVSGAKSYNVYRKTQGEEFQLVGKTTQTTFYDREAKKNNLNYYYSVQAIGKSSEGSFGSDTKKVLYMAAPVISSVKWDGDGNEVSWKRVAGATAYRIYRKTPSGDYEKIAEVSGTLTFVDTTAKKGGKYYYTVKAMNGKVAGAYAIGKGINCLDAPVISGVSQTKDGYVSVKWEAVSKADGYYVYRKAEGGKWVKLKKTAALSFTDKSKREKGVIYHYTVKAYNSKGNGLYNTIGKSL